MISEKERLEESLKTITSSIETPEQNADGNFDSLDVSYILLITSNWNMSQCINPFSLIFLGEEEWFGYKSYKACKITFFISWRKTITWSWVSIRKEETRSAECPGKYFYFINQNYLTQIMFFNVALNRFQRNRNYTENNLIDMKFRHIIREIISMISSRILPGCRYQKYIRLIKLNQIFQLKICLLVFKSQNFFRCLVSLLPWTT